MSDSSLAPTALVSEDFWAFDSPIVFDSLEGKKSYLIYGKNGSQIKLSSSAYVLLKSVGSGTSFSELAHTLNLREGEKKVTEDELRSQHASLLAKLQALETQASRQKAPWGFWMQFRMVREEHVARIAAVASFLYHPAAVTCVVAVLLAGLVAVFYKGFPFTLASGSILPGFAVFLVALLAHEFGHASACARYGARPSDIGFTFYLIYPAFYSDVSSAWKLSRGQRVIVDLGGCYFQAIVTAAFLLLFYRTGWEVFHAAIIFSLYSALSSLNPILKFDGYWVVADALGVSNLSRQPKRIYLYLLGKLRGQPTEHLPWPPFVTAALVVYSGLAIFVWIYFVSRLLPMLQGQLVTAGHAAAAVGKRILSGSLPLWQDVTTLFFSCLFLMLVAITIWSIGRMLYRLAANAMAKVVRYFRRGQSQTLPVGRACKNRPAWVVKVQEEPHNQPKVPL